MKSIPGFPVPDTNVIRKGVQKFKNRSKGTWCEEKTIERREGTSALGKKGSKKKERRKPQPRTINTERM